MRVSDALPRALLFLRVFLGLLVPFFTFFLEDELAETGLFLLDVDEEDAEEELGPDLLFFFAPEDDPPTVIRSPSVCCRK